jgi:hypothetical protein
METKLKKLIINCTFFYIVDESLRLPEVIEKTNELSLCELYLILYK